MIRRHSMSTLSDTFFPYSPLIRSYFGVIRAVGPVQAGWSSVLIPIIAMGFSTVFEGYHWAPLSIACCAVTLVGLVIAVAKRPEKPSVSGNMVSLPVESDG